MIHILVYVLAVPCPLGFMLLEILAMIMKYIYLSIYHAHCCAPHSAHIVMLIVLCTGLLFGRWRRKYICNDKNILLFPICPQELLTKDASSIHLEASWAEY